MNWFDKQYDKFYWYIKLYYHWISLLYWLKIPFYSLGVLYRRKTNTHAKWCYANFDATKVYGCCCQKYWVNV